jgi:hypothetical protein
LPFNLRLVAKLKDQLCSLGLEKWSTASSKTNKIKHSKHSVPATVTVPINPRVWIWKFFFVQSGLADTLKQNKHNWSFNLATKRKLKGNYV